MTYNKYKNLHISKILSKFEVVDKVFYVYRITNILEGRYYYGSRVCNINPRDDIGVIYFSSSYDQEFLIDQKNNPENYKYKVVRVCTDNVDKQLFESYLHNKFDVKSSSKFYNKANQTPTGFDCTGHTYNLGKITSEETKTKLSKLLKGRIISKEAKEKMRIHALNRTKEENLKRGIKHKGKIVSDETKMLQKINNTGSSNPFAKITLIYNAEDLLMEVCDGTFKTVCKNKGYPHSTLKLAKDGKKLYINIDGIISKNILNENRKYIGWHIKIQEKTLSYAERKKHFDSIKHLIV